MSNMDNAQLTPVPVVIGGLDDFIKNFATAWARPRYVKNSSVTTYILDPAGEDNKYVQIASYEVNRTRLVVIPSADVLITTDQPTVYPELAPPVDRPVGGLLPAGIQPYVFLGPDAFWLNSITGETAAAVTVIKEYC